MIITKNLFELAWDGYIMEIEEKCIWQVAAGEKSRHYEDIFCDWGIAAIGPGWCGKWDEVKYNESEIIKEVEKDGMRSRRVLRDFASRVKAGDYIVLKIGKDPIAVGEVQKFSKDKVYFWKESFRMIDGWDLGHCIKVKWKKLTEEEKSQIPKLSDSKFCRVHSNNREIINTFKNNASTVQSKSTQDIECLPIPKILEENEFKSRLEEELQTLHQTNDDNSKDKINGIWKTISNLKKTAEDFEMAEGSEEEAKIFFIVPLLQSLGWTYKNIAIEHGNLDFALSREGFNSRSLKEEKGKVDIMIEAKHLGGGLESAAKQAKDYYKKGLTNLKLIVVSNGINYYTYVKDGDSGWNKSAYLDIYNLWADGPPYRPGVGGAITLLAQLIL